MRERGNDIGVIANKMIILVIQLIKPKRWFDRVWSFPLAVPVAVMATAMLCAAHISMYLQRGAVEDPLGYFIKASRRNDEAFQTS